MNTPTAQNRTAENGTAKEAARSPQRATDALVAMLGGRGRATWLAGVSAHRRLAGEPLPPCADIITEASQDECAEVRALAGELGDVEHLRVTPLSGRRIEEVVQDVGARALAVAVPAEGGDVVDPVGGMAEADQGQLRTLEAPERAFRENPGLLLVIPATLAWTDWNASADLRRYATRDSGNILDTRSNNEGWGHEINRLLLGQNVERAMQWLQDTRVLAFIMPEVAAMVGFDKTCAVHHKDIWDHTKQVTQKAAPDLVVRWAALCHDIGKIWTRTVNRAGKVHFFRHEEHGALLFESIAHRFGLGEALTFRTSYLIENHSRVNLYRDDWTDSAVRRMMRETGDHLTDLLTFSKADYTTKRASRIAEMQRLMAELEARIARIAAEDAKVPPLTKGIGNAIIERFALRPSRLIGDLKRRLEEVIENGALPERGEDAVYLDWLAADASSAEAIEAGGGRI